METCTETGKGFPTKWRRQLQDLNRRNLSNCDAQRFNCMNLILGLEACKYTHTHHTPHAHTHRTCTHTPHHIQTCAHTHTISDGHCNITSLILDTQHRMIILVTINRLSYTFLIFELTSCHSIFVFAIFGTVDCRSFILLLKCWPPHFSFFSCLVSQSSSLSLFVIKTIIILFWFCLVVWCIIVLKRVREFLGMREVWMCCSETACLCEFLSVSVRDVSEWVWGRCSCISSVLSVCSMCSLLIQEHWH